MRRSFVVVAVLCAGLVPLPAGGLERGPSAPRDDRHVVVRLSGGADPHPEGATVRKLARGFRVVTLPPGLDVDAALAAYRAHPAVEVAEPHVVYKVADTPNDPRFPDQWGLRNTGQNGGTPGADAAVPEGWALAGVGGSGTWPLDDYAIGLIDTGVQLDHPELAGRVVQPCRSFLAGNGTSVPGCADDHGHGTSMAGIVNAATNNNLGIAGVAPNARIYPCKALNIEGAGFDADVVSCIDELVSRRDSHGVRVISMSFSSHTPSSMMRAAVDAAWAAGVLLLSAAGNDGDATMNFPAGYDSVVGVGATTRTDSRASFSNFNSSVEVTAPGQAIVSTALGGGFMVGSGTSQATAFAAGVAGLVSRAKGHTVQALRNALIAGAEDLGPPGRDNSFGYGRLNMCRSLGGCGAAQIPVSSWFVGEGATHSGFQYYILIGNPSGLDATVDVSFMTERGGFVEPAALRGKTVAAGKRETIRVNDFVANDNVSTIVESFGAPVVVDGSLSLVGSLGKTAFRGVNQTSTRWYFAEGANHSGYSTYIQIANPSDDDALVSLHVHTQKQGSFTVAGQSVTSLSRRTFSIGTLMASRGRSPDNFAVEVESTNGVPIVVYGSMDRFEPSPPADRIQAASAGVPSTATEWFLAEGATHSGFSSYVLIGNPDSIPARVEVRLLGQADALPLPPLDIPPRARATVRVNDHMPNANVGAQVISTPNAQGDRAGIVVFGSVDRTNVRGRAQDFTSASPETARGWVSAEGATHSGLGTFALILNPNPQPTRYSVTILRGNGPPVVAATNVVLGGQRRATVDIDAFVPSDNVSVVVTVPDGEPGVVVEVTVHQGEKGPAPGYDFSRNVVTPATNEGIPL